MLKKEKFPELISPFLKKRIESLKNEGRYEDARKLKLQYEYNSNEEDVIRTATARHYEADSPVTNVERLYAHHCCIEINFVCKAHCRYCLRSNYDKWTITDQQIHDAVQYVKNEHLTEVLITGGDPFLTVDKLYQLCEELAKNCPELRIFRIATRTITQDPEYILDPKYRVLETLEKIKKLNRRVEVATQINTWVELDDKTVEEAIAAIQELGILIYSQNVFLKGVNDEPDGSELIKLYQYMRYNGIEAHYLFHCDDVRGAGHFRTSVHDMVRCYEKLVNSGQVPGRCKPMMALMTGIGKVILTDLNAIEYKGDSLWIRSQYRLEDRLKYNPNWKVPDDAFVDKDGYLWIEYRGEALQIRMEDKR